MVAFNKNTLRNTAYFAGVLLGIAGLIFVGLQIRQFQSSLSDIQLGVAGYIVLAMLAISFAGMNVLLALGWRSVLAHLDVGVSARWSVGAYAASQLAKYIPGNLFLYVSRQAIGASAGIAHVPLAKSAVYEFALLGLGAIAFIPLLLPVVTDGAYTLLSIGGFVVASVAVVSLVARYFDAAMLRAMALYFIFLVLSGVIFTGSFFVANQFSLDASDASVLIGAYVMAWLVGLITPGAPAGLGVREAVLIALLQSIAATPVVLVAVLLNRAITLFGDVIFFAGGQLPKDS